MEVKYAVNCYLPIEMKIQDSVGVRAYGEGRIYTLNLSAGVTPAFITVGRQEYSSSFYRLSLPHIRIPEVVISHVFYRPNRSVFDALEESMQKHVLHGGLLHAELAVHNWNLTAVDPITHKWSWEQMQEFFETYYGRRLESK